MSRLDNFEEILKSYEGRTEQIDYAGMLRESLREGVYVTAYDAFKPEIKQKLVKYFEYAKKTGKLLVFDKNKDGFNAAETEEYPYYFEGVVYELFESDEVELKKWLARFDKAFGVYEKNEQTRQF